MMKVAECEIFLLLKWLPLFRIVIMFGKHGGNSVLVRPAPQCFVRVKHV